MKNKTSIIPLFIVLVISLSLLSGISYSNMTKGSRSKRVEYDPHAIIVKFKPGTISLPFGGYEVETAEAAISSSSIRSLNNRYKLKKLKKIFRDAQEGVTRVWNKRGKLVEIRDVSGYYKIYFPEGADVNKVLSDYSADPAVESAAMDYKMRMAVIPADTSFALQWALSNKGQSGGTPGCDINAPRAWDICKGTSEVVIPIIQILSQNW